MWFDTLHNTMGVRKRQVCVLSGITYRDYTYTHRQGGPMCTTTENTFYLSENTFYTYLFENTFYTCASCLSCSTRAKSCASARNSCHMCVCGGGLRGMVVCVCVCVCVPDQDRVYVCMGVCVGAGGGGRVCVGVGAHEHLIKIEVHSKFELTLDVFALAQYTRQVVRYVTAAQHLLDVRGLVCVPIRDISVRCLAL